MCLTALYQRHWRTTFLVRCGYALGGFVDFGSYCCALTPSGNYRSGPSVHCPLNTDRQERQVHIILLRTDYCRMWGAFGSVESAKHNDLRPNSAPSGVEGVFELMRHQQFWDPRTGNWLERITVVDVMEPQVLSIGIQRVSAESG